MKIQFIYLEARLRAAGADGFIGDEVIARSPPDGYALVPVIASLTRCKN